MKVSDDMKSSSFNAKQKVNTNYVVSYLSLEMLVVRSHVVSHLSVEMLAVRSPRSWDQNVDCKTGSKCIVITKITK